MIQTTITVDRPRTMTDEDRVIDRIRQDYVRFHMEFNSGLELLLRSVYRAGYKQYEIELAKQRLTELETRVNDMKGQQ